MRSLGICLGASTVTLVELSEVNNRRAVERAHIEAHEGNPRHVLNGILSGMDIGCFDSIAVTGRKFRHLVNLTAITEPEAVENALDFVNGHDSCYTVLVSAGGETFMVYVLDNNNNVIEPGETVDLYVNLLNIGEQTAHNIDTSISSTSPCIVTTRHQLNLPKRHS